MTTSSIDYAKAVLSKYPDAYALSDKKDKEWCCIINPLGHGFQGWQRLSEWYTDRDAAWRDAYERLVRP